MKANELMKIAKKTGRTVNTDDLFSPLENAKMKPAPTSTIVAQSLEDIQIYATLREDISFLDGGMDVVSYVVIVRSRIAGESVQTLITDYFY